MDKILDLERPNAQKKYRKKQANSGLVRYEIQVHNKTKQQFEQLVEVAAEEIPSPWSLRQRMAKARTRLFDEISKGVLHDFFELKEKIRGLRAEIAALAPTYFKSVDANEVPLPEAITALPDDPKKLKKLLAITHAETQQAKLNESESKRIADQYEALYNAQTTENERLKQHLSDIE